MANQSTLNVRAYTKDGMYYAKDNMGRLWSGAAKTKASLRKQISTFNKKNINAPKLILK